jgi:hypothetical protein
LIENLEGIEERFNLLVIKFKINISWYKNLEGIEERFNILVVKFKFNMS